METAWQVGEHCERVGLLRDCCGVNRSEEGILFSCFVINLNSIQEHWVRRFVEGVLRIRGSVE